MNEKARAALQRCRKIWEVEAQHGTGDKDKMYELAGLEPGSDIGDCPLCAYYITTHSYKMYSYTSNCGKRCLVRWPSYYSHCNLEGSPYAAWKLSSSKKTRKFFAKQIVALCDEALQ